MWGAVHSESAPSPHPQKARRSLPHRDGFPGKGAHKQQDKEGQIADAQQVGDDQKGNPSNIGLTVGTASLAIAAEPNRHANGHNQQHKCRCCQPGKRKHHANAHSNNREQQQPTPTPTGTINGSLSASFHRHPSLNIFEPYNAIAWWTGTILSSSGSMRLFSASRSNAIWARSQ